MPETRFIEEYDGRGNMINKIPYEVSDEQLTDEAEERELAKAGQLIDQITNLAQAKRFLKRLCSRLLKKGYLP